MELTVAGYDITYTINQIYKKKKYYKRANKNDCIFIYSDLFVEDTFV